MNHLHVIKVLERYIDTMQRTMDFFRTHNKGEEFQQAFEGLNDAIKARDDVRADLKKSASNRKNLN